MRARAVVRRFARKRLERSLDRFRLMTGSYRQWEAIDLSRVSRLVFVCQGNICRSPFAAGVARAAGMEAVSGGVQVTRSDPAPQFALRAAEMHGIDLSFHRSSSMDKIEVDGNDCLVGMERGHLSALKLVRESEKAQSTLLGLWSNPKVGRIGDPYGGELAVFMECFELIEDSVNRLVARIRSASGAKTDDSAGPKRA